MQASSCIDRRFDAVGRIGSRFVLPNAHDSPSRRHEPLISIGVSADVGLQFRKPPFMVSTRNSAMLGTPMPEASIHEDRYTRPYERDVDGSSGSRHCAVDPVSEATSE